MRSSSESGTGAPGGGEDAEVEFAGLADVDGCAGEMQIDRLGEPRRAMPAYLVNLREDGGGEGGEDIGIAVGNLAGDEEAIGGGEEGAGYAVEGVDLLDDQGGSGGSGREESGRGLGLRGGGL